MRLIDADLLGLSDMEIIMCDGDYKEALKILIDKISKAPTIEERKTGEWIKIGRWGRHYKCSNCGNTLDFNGVNAGRGDANFCPNCGSYNGKKGENENI